MLKRCLFILSSLTVSVLLFILVSCQAGRDFDILIKNGKIIDGTGNPWYYGNIGIKGDTIAAIGNLSAKTSAQVIDAQGLVVSPGFIDVHTHCDRGLGKPETTSNINYITQGVTTVVTGNCGSGSFKIAKTRAEWKKQGIGTNAIMLVGFGTIRTAVMGVDARSATQEELEKMKSILRQAMTEGAWGLSVALQYIPDRFALTEELMAMTRVIDEFGGVFNSHQRSEEGELIEAVKETIRIGEETGVRVNATHLKASGKDNWGLLQDVVTLITAARNRGVSITSDLYTYPQCVYSPIVLAFNVPDDMEPLTELNEMLDYYYILRRLGVSIDEVKNSGKLPPMGRQELLEKYAEELAKALSDTIKRERIKRLTLEGAPEKLNWVPMFGWDSFTIVKVKRNPQLVGKIISDLAIEQNRNAFDIAADLFIKEKNDLVISVFTMAEDDISFALKQDWMMVGSDSGASLHKPGSEGHPGSYGTFTRILRKYVREEKVLTLENAIRKISSLPAQFLSIKDRGLLLEGYKADIVVFDPDAVRDCSTVLDAHRLSTGIEYVILNGKVSVKKGQYTNALNGKVLLLTSQE